MCKMIQTEMSQNNRLLICINTWKNENHCSEFVFYCEILAASHHTLQLEETKIFWFEIYFISVTNHSYVDTHDP